MRNALILALALAGCYAAPEQGAAPDDGGDAAVTPFLFPRGIYQVTSFVDAYTCTPSSSPAPVMQLAVDVEGGGASATVPLIDLTPGGTGTLGSPMQRWDADGGVRTHTFQLPGSCARATFTRSLWLANQDSTSFDEHASDTWTDVVACDDGGEPGGIPLSNCTSALTMHFELVQACPSACHLMPDWTAPIYRDACVCDGGG